MTSATQAPSRMLSVSIAGYQAVSGMALTMSLIRKSTGKPKENPTPSSRQAAAKVCVAPAESDRASTRGESGSPGRGRACSGNAAIAISRTVTWSAAVFDPALPARSSPASASPPATSGRSRNASNGWNPNVLFHVAAAFSFSLCATVIVASKSMHSSSDRSGPAPAAHARSLATARAARTAGRWTASTRSSTRHAVGIEATGPKTS